MIDFSSDSIPAIAPDEVSMTDLIKALEGVDRGFPPLHAGDTVRVHVQIVEGTRKRVQVFQGIIIRKRGGGQGANFTVRRIASHGIGVERTFLYRSPRIDKIEVLRHGQVRRAQLYYMRNLSGKAARLRERRDLVTTPTAPESSDNE